MAYCVGQIEKRMSGSRPFTRLHAGIAEWYQVRGAMLSQAKKESPVAPPR
jgi:hypothetical protein